MSAMRLLSIACLIFLFACKQQDKHLSASLVKYYDYNETGIKDGGVKMIPVKTPAGEFKVWTKRFGTNPTIKGLVISNMMARAADYGKYANEVLARQFDPKVLAEVRALEAKNDYHNPRYMELLMNNYYNQHICRVEWPEPLNRCFKHMNEEVY